MQSVFQSKNRIMHITAALLIGCMALTDVSLYADSVKNTEYSHDDNSSAKTVITEEHVMPEVYVDGEFGGNGSDYAIGGEGEYVDADKKRSINILEILPDKRMAHVGYTIAGCEPIGSAAMDAIVNQEPGVYNQYVQGIWRPKFNTSMGDLAITDLSMNEGANGAAMYYYATVVRGYYEYVGSGKGVYALKEIPSGSLVEGDYVKNATMVSKFVDKTKKYKTGYDYVWVEDSSLKSFADESEDHKTKISDVATGKNIYVYDHWKNKYVNNELFLCVMSDICSGLNHNIGAYSGGKNNEFSNPSVIKPNSNYNVLQEWRKDYTVRVITKDPRDITPADVDSADLIMMSSGTSDGSYNKAFSINCYAWDDSGNNKKSFSPSNDISVDVMKRIYKHVVVDEDCAIAYSVGLATNEDQFNTNVGRLGCMLFFLYNSNITDNDLNEGESTKGSGRDFFVNILPDFGPKNGSDERDLNDRIQYTNNGALTTDYLYINDDGDVVIDGQAKKQSNGGWIKVGDNYPWNGQYFNGEWLFNDDLLNTFGFANGKGYYGKYADGSPGRYRNQFMFGETDSLFAYSDWGGAKGLFSIMSNIEPTPHYVEEGETKKSYFLSMNIVNGDSVTKEAGTDDVNDFNRNKMLYINKYEINEMPADYKLPIIIKIVTSHPIKSISVTKTKRSGTPLQEISTYSLSSGVLQGGGNLGALTLEDETDYSDGKAPYIAEKDYYKYTLSGEIKLEKKWFQSGTNNTIMIEATNEVGKNAKDLITIVTRDFFGLN